MFRKGISDLISLFSWQAYGKKDKAFFLSLVTINDCEECTAMYKISMEWR